MIVLMVIPIDSTSCVSRSRCTSENRPNEAISSTPSTWPSNRIGMTTICPGREELSAVSIVNDSAGT